MKSTENQEKKVDTGKTQNENPLEKEMDHFISTFAFLMKDRYSRKNDTPREQVRLDANFKPIETLTK